MEKLRFVPMGVYREVGYDSVAVIHALEMTFGTLPLKLGMSQYERLIAMHYAYNAGRNQHGRETPFGILAEAIQKYDYINIVKGEDNEH